MVAHFHYLISLCKNITEISGPAPIFASNEGQCFSSSPIRYNDMKTLNTIYTDSSMCKQNVIMARMDSPGTCVQNHTMGCLGCSSRAVARNMKKGGYNVGEARAKFLRPCPLL